VPFWLIHLSLAALPFVQVTPSLVVTCMSLYVLRMWGVTAGYHRYFSHRTFKTSRGFQFVLALLAVTSIQKGVLWWAAHHRHHHRHSDDPQDVHSPRQRGFWWSHVGWVLSPDWHETHYDGVKDLARFPELVLLDRWHWVPPTLLGFGLLAWGGWPLVLWGFCLSTVLLWHGTFAINSLSHVFGSRRYATDDDSRNNAFFALLTLGEGWHNNHHHYQSSTRQGFFWWEFDPCFYGLRLLEKLGVVWELRSPPPHVVAETIANGLQPSALRRPVAGAARAPAR
jgi:stearoyl-CoA desaturase (delta-9 desaturase)